MSSATFRDGMTALGDQHQAALAAQEQRLLQQQQAALAAQEQRMLEQQKAALDDQKREILESIGEEHARVHMCASS